MLGLCRRWWPNIISMLGRCLVFAVICLISGCELAQRPALSWLQRLLVSIWSRGEVFTAVTNHDETLCIFEPAVWADSRDFARFAPIGEFPELLSYSISNLIFGSVRVVAVRSFSLRKIPHQKNGFEWGLRGRGGSRRISTPGFALLLMNLSFFGHLPCSGEASSNLELLTMCLTDYVKMLQQLPSKYKNILMVFR